MEQESQAYSMAATAAMMGYACRMAYDNELPVEIVEGIEPYLIRNEDGQVEIERQEPDRFKLVHETVATLAGDEFTIADLAGTDWMGWGAFSAFATFSLQANFVQGGVRKRRLIPADRLEELLCLGYAIRVVDEVAGLEPVRKADLDATE